MQWGSADFCSARIGPCPDPFEVGEKFWTLYQRQIKSPKIWWWFRRATFSFSLLPWSFFFVRKKNLIAVLILLFSKNNKNELHLLFPPTPNKFAIDSFRNKKIDKAPKCWKVAFNFFRLLATAPRSTLTLPKTHHFLVPWKMLDPKRAGFGFRNIGKKKRRFRGVCCLVLGSSQKRWHQKPRKTYPKELRAFFGPNFWRNIKVATKSGVEKIRAK